ncbi:DUF4340 domain-containing protein [Hahella sp. KA22]|uniref:DUF4340 domain-containing protein n=1 Tax=Hahella sp. KA22 TaxID=1628392 RepID=UPI000FDF18A0|nr:DUF4340 domain-containing protein [Hahella sp. KA22]AZZ91422.1 DUF4340 domain-containing protein [Hahella sp. KA22]QAY54792.1 DUF4340 domain-containing protein [Hahella sp. KA22]
MNAKWTKLLSIALVAQAAIIIALHWPGSQPAYTHTDQALLDLESKQPGAIHIYGEETAKVDLKKEQDGWVVASYYNLPVANDKVDAMLAKLKALKASWPVATTASGAKRFEVAEDKFQRKLELAQGDDTLATLYLGTSPGYRKVHARLNEQDAVFAVNYATHELPMAGKDWVDNKLTAVPEESINQVKIKDIVLNKNGDKWDLEGLQEGEITNEEAAHKLLASLADMRFEDVLGAEVKPEYNLSEPKLRFTLQLKEKNAQGEQSLELNFGKPAEGDYYILTRSDRPQVFKIDASHVDSLLDLERARFVSAAPVTEPEQSEVNLGQQGDAAEAPEAPASS